MAPQMALFLKSKITRQIQYNGSVYTFAKHIIDKFGQVSDEIGEEVTVNGIFHTVNSYIKNTDSEGARLISKPQPRMLMLVEDGSKIGKDDVVVINGNKYKVTGKEDVSNFGVAFDVSLEPEA